MDVHAFGTLALIGLSLTLLNDIVICRLWPRWLHSNRDASARRKQIVATLVINPLVASIVCPMVSDLYFALIWAASCDTFYSFTMAVASLSLYISSLVFCHRLVELDCLMLRTPQQGQEHPNQWSWWRKVTCESFTFSVFINFLVTLVTLLLTGNSVSSAYQLFEGENCWNSLMHRHAFFIFALCFSLCAIQVVFYAGLSKSIGYTSHYQPVGAWGGKTSSGDDALADYSKDNDNSTSSKIVYTLAALLCLSLTNLVRMCFAFCSCHAYVLAASNLYYMLWLVVAKLPIAGVLYWILNHFRCLPLI